MTIRELLNKAKEIHESAKSAKNEVEFESIYNEAEMIDELASRELCDGFWLGDAREVLREVKRLVHEAIEIVDEKIINTWQ